ncbi:MAG: aryl-sulfate sulfotransferase [Chitinophaga sp.]|uniref:aryl-sulfate sulfotransferase n=1 Tax=Chitinophaga sp. TaxID=1869181 RepID=UPI0025BB4D9B|nr:aryl-sulfate sulfotransferase [Chitinophaga sp.]MBV8252056.1 aryl-sulfate sulfotransferase [Chitinophaga sp.]
MKRPLFLYLLLLICIFAGCATSADIEDIHIDNSHTTNPLLVTVQLKLSVPAAARMEYWALAKKNQVYTTALAASQKEHHFQLLTLGAEKQYGCRIILTKGKDSTISDTYSFTTKGLPEHLAEMCTASITDSTALPRSFKAGYLLLYKRDSPGNISLVEYTGNIRWITQFQHTGVKVAHFTDQHTILSILAPMSYPTSYGNEILELSLNGDTLLHLKKGEKDFQHTIHHEILLHKNHIITLSVKDTVMDLSTIGGSHKDTLNIDGITVLDRKGHKVWEWNVLQCLNPLLDKQLLEEKKDWMHANSLDIDTDGNYLISFYNNGQIWKVDAHSGKLIWKFGRGGDFNIPAGATFERGHAVHKNHNGDLLLFDNGNRNRQSQVLSFHLDEKQRTASLNWKTLFLPGVYTDRMGSAYEIADGATVLSCVSKLNKVYLTDRKGRICWQLFCINIPYRAEFIPAESL